MSIVLPAIAVAFGACFIWVLVRMANCQEAWANQLKNVRVALAVIIVAGVATVYNACLLPQHWTRGTPLPREYIYILWFTVPQTVLFALAALVSWKSVKTQRKVAVTAALVAALSIAASLPSLFSEPQLGTSQITPGLLAYISWIFGIVVSCVFVLVVAAENAWRSWRERKSSSQK